MDERVNAEKVTNKLLLCLFKKELWKTDQYVCIYFTYMIYNWQDTKDTALPQLLIQWEGLD